MEIVLVDAPAVNTQPATIAYRWGAEDGDADLPCVPELYFSKHAEHVDYALGHQSTAGKTLLSCQLLHNGPVPVPADLDIVFVPAGIDYDAELADLREAMADASFWAGGYW